ncbi:hypothetical protein B0J14DRAFT_655621 [Halenospora varia]|nr:hypothetical protein B0J14DRAFT_655621 [Halenospora varia]
MYFIHHTAKSWQKPTRRAQRCLTFAVVFAIIIILGLYEKAVYPRPSQLQLDTMDGVHRYSSSPEAGMPGLPFKDNSVRKATEEPFFGWGEAQQ